MLHRPPVPQLEPGGLRPQVPTAKAMTDHASQPGADDLRSLIHRLNNQLGVILAHAELLEAKAPDEGQRARATQVVSAALQAMCLAREIRTSMSEPE
jgi:hypothetical protein